MKGVVISAWFPCKQLPFIRKRFYKLSYKPTCGPFYNFYVSGKV